MTIEQHQLLAGQMELPIEPPGEHSANSTASADDDNADLDQMVGSPVIPHQAEETKKTKRKYTKRTNNPRANLTQVERGERGTSWNSRALPDIKVRQCPTKMM